MSTFETSRRTRGPELEVTVGVAVGPQRHLVLGTAVDVVEHAGWQPALGDPAEIVDVSRCRQPALRPVELEAAEPQHGAQRVEHLADAFEVVR